MADNRYRRVTVSGLIDVAHMDPTLRDLLMSDRKELKGSNKEDQLELAIDVLRSDASDIKVFLEDV